MDGQNPQLDSGNPLTYLRDLAAKVFTGSPIPSREETLSPYLRAHRGPWSGWDVVGGVMSGIGDIYRNKTNAQIDAAEKAIAVALANNDYDRAQSIVDALSPKVAKALGYGPGAFTERKKGYERQQYADTEQAVRTIYADADKLPPDQRQAYLAREFQRLRDMGFPAGDIPTPSEKGEYFLPGAPSTLITADALMAGLQPRNGQEQQAQAVRQQVEALLKAGDAQGAATLVQASVQNGIFSSIQNRQDFYQQKLNALMADPSAGERVKALIQELSQKGYPVDQMTSAAKIYAGQVATAQANVPTPHDLKMPDGTVVKVPLTSREWAEMTMRIEEASQVAKDRAAAREDRRDVQKQRQDALAWGRAVRVTTIQLTNLQKGKLDAQKKLVAMQYQVMQALSPLGKEILNNFMTGATSPEAIAGIAASLSNPKDPKQAAAMQAVSRYYAVLMSIAGPKGFDQQISDVNQKIADYAANAQMQMPYTPDFGAPEKPEPGGKEGPSGIKLSPDQQQWRQRVAAAAQQAGVPVPLALAVAYHESQFNPRAVGSRGERGIMQVMPENIKAYGKDPKDPNALLAVGMDMLRDAIRQNGGDWEKALIQYNAGPHPDAEASKKGQAYARSILSGVDAWKKIERPSPRPSQLDPQVVQAVQAGAKNGIPWDFLSARLLMQWPDLPIDQYKSAYDAAKGKSGEAAKGKKNEEPSDMVFPNIPFGP